MKRFVILLHEHPRGAHWDVMLEAETALTTWAVPPQILPPEAFECCAKILPEHRLHYLDYEGQVSNNRGSVFRIDAGVYETTRQNQFRLYGKLFNGILSISESDDGTTCSMQYQPVMPRLGEKTVNITT